MKKAIQFTIAICLCQFILSCGSTQYIPMTTSYTNIQEIPCSKNLDSITEFFSYYDGEKLDFKYTALGHLSYSNGNNYEGDILDNLKYHAAKKCADGVVNINSNSHTGSYTSTDYNYEQDKCTKKYKYVSQTSHHNYNVQNFTALAVKLTEQIPNAGPPRQDTIFVNRYNKSKTNPVFIKHEEDNSLRILSAILSIPIAILLYEADKK
jgi:hypothetical protein